MAFPDCYNIHAMEGDECSGMKSPDNVVNDTCQGCISYTLWIRKKDLEKSKKSEEGNS